ncbi:MAG: SCO family protein [Rhodocyclaceae bacterium]|jgi:protein SCO1/2|nr:SCO family protein [Rhodocyclaceae bacterium]MCL4759282.1 SCO family protein [Rhodocyclaceae bacterium]
MPSSFRGLILLALLAFMLAACSAPEAPRFNAANMTGVEYGKDLRMQDADGKERTLADFRGKVVMIFFGFTQCPDVCPTALSRAVAVRGMLGEDAKKMQMVFITVDPERDTPEVLRAYMLAFDPDFVALHAPLARTAEIAKSFNVFYQKVPTGDSYTMDHTATSFVFDPTGRLRLAVPHNMPPELIAADIKTLLATTR